MTASPDNNFLFTRPDQVKDPLYVVTMISNPVRFRTRWKLYEDFAKQCEEAGAILYTVEVAFGDRAFAITKPDNPHHIQLRTKHELWHKENAINIGISRLPPQAKYIAWVDADVHFVRGDWANETIHQLQHYDFVQMWSHAYDGGPNFEMLGNYMSFAYCYIHGLPRTEDLSAYQKKHCKVSYYWHPGYAWAAKRSALDHVGGLMDHCVLGSADYHMAFALVGTANKTIHPKYNPRYTQLIKQWEREAEKYIKRNIGYVSGALFHPYHGSKKSRRYIDRYKVLVDTQFNPDVHIKKDSQGLWQLTDASLDLRDKLKAYFRQRDEDMTNADENWANHI